MSNIKLPQAVVTLLISCCVLLTPAPSARGRVAAGVIKVSAVPPAIDFYRSLTEAIDSVSAQLTLELNTTSRRWRTKVTGTPDFEWIQVPLQPGVRHFITTNISYAGGALRAGAGGSRPYVEFRPSIVVSMIPATAQSQVISKIYFDAAGRPVEYWDGNQNNTGVLGAWAGLAEHMRIPLAPGGLFQNGPFRWTATPLDPGGTGPFVKRMLLAAPPPNASAPGAAVALKEDAKIIFSSGQQNPALGDNYVVTAGNSNLRITSLSYDFTTQALDGSLADLSFTLGRAVFTSADFSLGFGGDSKLSFRAVDIHDAPGAAGGSSIRATGGRVAGILNFGSQLGLAGGAGRTLLTADVDSDVVLDPLTVEVTNQSSSFEAGPDSRVRLRLTEGRFPLAGGDFLLLGAETFAADLSAGVWRGGAAPAVSASNVWLTARITSGLFSLVSGKPLRLRGGSVNSSRLSLDSTRSPAVTGSYEDVLFEVEDGQLFDVPARFVAVSRSGTRLVANDANAPFTISGGAPAATGVFRAVIPFWTCYVPPVGSPVIRDSMLRSVFVLTAGGVGGSDEVVDYTCCAK